GLGGGGDGLAGDHGVDDAAEDGADDGRREEDPELRQRPAAHEDGGAEAPRRVYRQIGHGDADEMNQGQPEPDGHGRKPGGARLSVEPRMMKRNIRVSTVSATSAATRV